jgi:purine-binding chemotaxis protein CheW
LAAWLEQERKKVMTAEVLAAKKGTETIAAGKYLTFCLGRESYGVEVLKIREIIRVVNITAVPQMPAYVKGVINLRGKIIPVVDLRLKFGMAKAETTERTCIIVVQATLHSGQSSQMGLVVDGVEEVTNIAATDIEETPDFGTKLDTDSILGMARIKGAVKTLLDIDKVVSSDTVQRQQKIS